MPLVRIDVLRTYTPDERRLIGDCVHEALTEALAVPARDRFQVLTAHDPDDFDFDRNYLDIARSDRFVLVQVTLARGRTEQAKQAFYARLVNLLARRVDLRPEDLAVTLVENERQDWSFGRGEASYLVLPAEQWR